jgi:DNA segregation ATPase FtsK/SpoIIIE-like protein
MLRISKLETRFQEVVFLLTITSSLSIAIGGVFYLCLSSAGFISAAGLTGSSLIEKGFMSFGYTYFFFVIFMLHMGHLALATAHYVRDILRSYMIYFKSFSIYFTILLLISSFLTVLQNYNAWESSQHFAYGYGGWFGTLIGGILFRNFGLYGALVILFTLTSVIGISAGYMEIVHSFYVMKDIFKEIIKNIKEHGPILAKEIGNKIVDFLDQKPQYAGNVQIERRKSPRPAYDFSASYSSLQPANNGQIVTDHFHNPHSYNEIQDLIKEVEELREEKLKIELKEEIANENIQATKSDISLNANQSVLAQVEEPRKSRVKKAKEVKVEESTSASVEVSENKVVEEKNEELVEVKAWTKRYKNVETSLLEKPEKQKKKSEKEIKEICETLKIRLESFGIKGKIVDAHQGVTLTMFEFLPEAGMKLSKIQSLSDDLALVLGAKSIRILTPIPGKTTVGIEVPNKEISVLRFSEMISTCMKTKNMELPIPLGVDVYNKSHVNDLTKMPHILVSGTTGSGKSVFMNSLISGLIFHKSPKELRFLMIDPKMIELSPYNGIPHLLRPVVTDVEEAKNLLLWAEKEMDRRYQIFSDMQSKSITTFNEAVKKGSKRSIEGRLNKKINWNFEEMPYIVIVIDELADLMLTQRNEVERPITRIAQKARAAGIHMVMATQRPSSDIVTGLIKTNFPTRVSFKVSSNIDSRTILDQPGAEKLLGNGDMLYMAQGKAIERLQGSFMTEDEVKKVVRSVSAQSNQNKK